MAFVPLRGRSFSKISLSALGPHAQHLPSPRAPPRPRKHRPSSINPTVARPRPRPLRRAFPLASRLAPVPHHGPGQQSAACATSAACSWDAVRQAASIRVAVRLATRIFQRARTAEPCASAEHLAVACFRGVHTRASARADEAAPGADELARFVALCVRRAQHGVPVQYLVGDWDFHNVTVLVRAPVLIPRPETEELVELVLQGGVDAEEARILDVGTGSGCVMLAMLKARPRWTAVAVDVSTEAVRLCEENVRLLGFEDRSEVVLGRVKDLEGGERFDALVSNPPYIPETERETVDVGVTKHEDAGALFGGADGMDVIKEVLRSAPKVVRKGGKVWMEVDSSHPDKLRMMKFAGLEFVQVVKDMCGKERFCEWRVARQ